MFYIHTKCPFTPSYDHLPVAPTHAIPLTDTTAIFPLALSYPSFESQEIIKAVMKVVIVFSNEFKSNNNRNNSINYMSSKQLCPATMPKTLYTSSYLIFTSKL